MRIVLVAAACAALAACSTYNAPAVAYNGPAVVFGGPPLISGQSPPSPFARNSEPQPQGSLPPGFQGVGNSGPNQVYPNAGSVTVPVPF